MLLASGVARGRIYSDFRGLAFKLLRKFRNRASAHRAFRRPFAVVHLRWWQGRRTCVPACAAARGRSPEFGLVLEKLNLFSPAAEA